MHTATGDPKLLQVRVGAAALAQRTRTSARTACPHALAHLRALALSLSCAQLTDFERYRDLVKLTARGLPDAAGIEAALEEALTLRAQAQVNASAHLLGGAGAGEARGAGRGGAGKGGGAARAGAGQRERERAPDDGRGGRG